MTPSLRVLSPGVLSTVQDLGRPGWFASGVGVSGAADRGALTLANRLVGNPEGAAAIETLFGGLRLHAHRTTMFTVTGTDVPVTVDGVPHGRSTVVVARPGQQISLGLATAGVRTYLAVRGGVVVPHVLGSASHDTLANLGPAPLAVDDEIIVGPTTGLAWPVIDVAPTPPANPGVVIARAILGPRHDWVLDPHALFAGTWQVTDHADRIGLRLAPVDGTPPLRRSDDRELPTEGVALGAIQVPPSGEPVVFLADHPITGGYPVVATVVTPDVDLLAQARPGQSVRFRQCRSVPL